MRLATVVLGGVVLALGACRAEKDAAPTDTGGGTVDLSDADGDSFTTDDGDCDDANSAINPGAEEICDGIDNNCDGAVDEGVTSTFYADGDSDGFGSDTITIDACSQPSGYVSVGNDCDDGDGESYPGASERCDDADNDCDGEIDEEVRTEWYADADGDGYGNPDAAEETCDPPGGYVDNTDDCDDLDAAASPGAEEVCDDADNNCDGTVDEDATTTFYADADGDSYGLSDKTTEACSQPTGYAARGGDCDDTSDDVSPNATELCDTVDNDCDGVTDEDDAADAATWYADSDNDGYGDSSRTDVSCTQPSGYVSDSTDCDDSTTSANPGEAEVCDDIDNDCDGETDEDSATDAATWYADSDGDGYGSSASTTACEMPSGFADNSDDCNDSEAGANPGEAEVCDDIDNDCDGSTDEGVTATYYADSDGDGYGASRYSIDACSAPSGYTTDSTDCDDSDASSYPGATEVCDDADNDCDGTADDGLDRSYFYDGDGDGYGDDDTEVSACSAPSSSYVSDGGDCDDADTAYAPDATEGCDGEDYNCDGDVDSDADGDGYADASCGGDDCDDADDEIYPEDGGGCALGETCLEILEAGHTTSGVYTIDPDGFDTGVDPWEVYCDMSTSGGGWTLVAKTVKSGLSSADRTTIREGTWDDYTADGYGDPSSSSDLFWLPLSHWHELTDAYPDNVFRIVDSSYEIRVNDLEIGSSSNEYPIDWDSTVSGYSSIVSTAIQGQRFTTHDNDNDTWSANCASDNVGYNGGWWYTNCYQLSMLHSNGNVYSWTTNVSRSVNYLYLYFREN